VFGQQGSSQQPFGHTAGQAVGSSTAGQVCASFFAWQHDGTQLSGQALAFAAGQQTPAWLHLEPARLPTSAFPARSTVASTSTTIRTLAILAVIFGFLTT